MKENHHHLATSPTRCHERRVRFPNYCRRFDTYFVVGSGWFGKAWWSLCRVTWTRPPCVPNPQGMLLRLSMLGKERHSPAASRLSRRLHCSCAGCLSTQRRRRLIRLWNAARPPAYSERSNEPKQQQLPTKPTRGMLKCSSTGQWSLVGSSCTTISFLWIDVSMARRIVDHDLFGRNE
jgi:hypothetical protein